MIEAIFELTSVGLSGVSVSGHKAPDTTSDDGRDILRAAVTSALLMTVNAITVVLKQKATAEVGENHLRLMLPIGASAPARDFLSSLLYHFKVLSEDYPGTINISVLEV